MRSLALLIPWSGREKPPSPKTSAAASRHDARPEPVTLKTQRQRLGNEGLRSAAIPTLQAEAEGRWGAPEGPPEKCEAVGEGPAARGLLRPHKRDHVPAAPVPRELHCRRPRDAVLPKRLLPILPRIRKDGKKPHSATRRPNCEDQTFT